jgi:hypothetical protein
MRPTQTATGLPEFRQPDRHHRRQSTTPGGTDADSLSLPLPSDEEFLSRFGDAIDDRIADILDELLAERSSTDQHRRLPYLLGVVSPILVGLLLVITAIIATR